MEEKQKCSRCGMDASVWYVKEQDLAQNPKSLSYFCQSCGDDFFDDLSPTHSVGYIMFCKEGTYITNDRTKFRQIESVTNDNGEVIAIVNS